MEPKVFHKPAKSAVALMWLLLMVVTSAQAGIIADSTVDFSGIQGGGGWYYGFFRPSGAGYDPAGFQQLPSYAPPSYAPTWASVWKHSVGEFAPAYPYDCPPWTLIGPNGLMHPAALNNAPYEEWVVLRWVSTISGHAKVTGRLAKANLNNETGQSNGVTGEIYLNGTPIFSQYIDPFDGTGANYLEFVTLSSGATLDFVLSPNGNDYEDGSIFTAQISLATPEPGTLSLLGLGLASFAILRRRLHRSRP